MKNFLVKKAVPSGVISGIFLGLFFKAVEKTTHLKVYTLLLNLDYVPVINLITLPEIIEFAIHLIISVILSISFLYFFTKKEIPTNKRPVYIVLVSLLIGILLYPTTALSNQTPALTNIPAILYWLVGHTLYGWLLGYLLRKI